MGDTEVSRLTPDAAAMVLFYEQDKTRLSKTKTAGFYPVGIYLYNSFISSETAHICDRSILPRCTRRTAPKTAASLCLSAR